MKKEKVIKNTVIVVVIIFVIIAWLMTSAVEDMHRLGDNMSDLIKGYNKELVTRYVSLLWSIFLILGLSLLILWFGSYLFEKLQTVCDKKQYGDFTKIYIRGLKTIGHLSLLWLPLILWIALWIIGHKLDTIFLSYKYYSEYAGEYYTSNRDWIMLILGFGSIPFMLALYFPIIKGIKRHVKENKGKKLLLDEITELKEENEELKERMGLGKGRRNKRDGDI